MNVSALAGLFPAGDFRYHLTMRRDEPRNYFCAQDTTDRVLAERRRWLSAEPECYAAMTREGEPLLAEFGELCAKEWGVVHGDSLSALGAALEPDFLLLSPDANGSFRLRGGVLCFPTGWALDQKLGQTVDFIHGVVPGLNPGLGSPIHQFLTRLKPRVAFLRDNWGITATDELNLHSSRHILPPAPPLSLDHLWLRVEHQALLALPRSRGVV